MGLVIGVHVKRQVEGFMCYGRNPSGTREEIEANFVAFLCERYADCPFSPGVSVSDQYYGFDVQIGYHWTTEEQNRLYLAITEFVYSQFSHVDGIHVTTFWSG
jgi:hypothetical protein